MIRLGIIGCGRIVAEAHVDALQNLTDLVHVVALADPSPDRTQLVGEALGVEPAHHYSDFAEMLERETLDCVDLAVPHFLHQSITVACAQEGLHIFAEKPLGTSLESVDRILQAVERAGVTLGIAHNYLYLDAYQAALEEIAAGRIGRPFLIRSESLGGSHFPGTPSYDPDWRTQHAQAGGGALLDNGYHQIYTAEALMGAPVAKVSGRVSTFVNQQDVDDTAVALLHHANGGVTSLQVSWAVRGGGKPVLEVHGTAGSLRLWEQDDRPLEIHQNTVGEWRPVTTDARPWASSFRGLMRDFFAALATGEQPKLGGVQARHNLAVIEAIYRAGAEEQVVSVGDQEEEVSVS